MATLSYQSESNSPPGPYFALIIIRYPSSLEEIDVQIHALRAHAQLTVGYYGVLHEAYQLLQGAFELQSRAPC